MGTLDSRACIALHFSTFLTQVNNSRNRCLGVIFLPSVGCPVPGIAAADPSWNWGWLHGLDWRILSHVTAHITPFLFRLPCKIGPDPPRSAVPWRCI
ncbi:hypothetical protein RSAG8_07578, partial [Rhizoctonia solani AG-8 WAC10335]